MEECNLPLHYADNASWTVHFPGHADVQEHMHAEMHKVCFLLKLT
jgi:hypothetical protein